jgi:Tetracyclin repressor-like, C-terminal domain
VQSGTTGIPSPPGAAASTRCCPVGCGRRACWIVGCVITPGRSRSPEYLENHPGTAALLKTRDPLSPTSLELAEAFLAPLLAAGLPGREAALAFRLVYDYTLGFALADPTSPAEQRLRDTATRERLHAFFRALPADRFPALAAIGVHAWDGDRDQRFAAGLDTLLRGLQADERLPGDSGGS